MTIFLHFCSWWTPTWLQIFQLHCISALEYSGGEACLQHQKNVPSAWCPWRTCSDLKDLLYWWLATCAHLPGTWHWNLREVDCICKLQPVRNKEQISITLIPLLEVLCKISKDTETNCFIQQTAPANWIKFRCSNFLSTFLGNAETQSLQLISKYSSKQFFRFFFTGKVSVT